MPESGITRSTIPSEATRPASHQEAPARPKQLAPAAQPIKNPDPIVKTFPSRSAPEPLTCEQLCDRREMLRQQIETLKAKRAQPAEAPESRIPIPLIESAEDAGRETLQ